MGSAVAGSRPWISWRQEKDSARALFAAYGIDLDPDAPVSSLSATERALLAILRAVEELGDRRTLLVLDEPTVFLPREGTDLLFSVVREIVADRKAAVLFVSHDLDEVLDHTDRVTILRDGLSQGTHRTDGLTAASLIDLIVGRALDGEHHAGTGRVFAGVPPLAQVSGLVTPAVDGIDFAVRPGEIVGLTGIAGSGYDDILPALYGAVRARSGDLSLGATRMPLPSITPIDALDAGVVYVPPDRKIEGSAPELTVAENVTLPVLGRLVKPRVLNGLAARIADQCDVRPRDPQATYGSLSGGNQQKALSASGCRPIPGWCCSPNPPKAWMWVPAPASSRCFATPPPAAPGSSSPVPITNSSRCSATG